MKRPNKFQFTHMFYRDGIPLSQLLEHLSPILKKIKAAYNIARSTKKVKKIKGSLRFFIKFEFLIILYKHLLPYF